MTLRYMLSADNGSTWIQVFPSGVPSPLIDWRRESSGTRATKKKEMGGQLVFSMDQGQFPYFNGLQDTATSVCDPLQLKVECSCGGEWIEIYQGEFARGGGQWDLDKCIFSIKPETRDRFTCLEKAWDIKRNILQAPICDVSVYSLPSLEFALCLNQSPFPGGCDMTITDGSSYFNGWTFGHFQEESAGVDIYNLWTFWREKVMTECVGGTPVPPPGSGWSLLEDNCATDGTAFYVRNPTISWTFGDLTRGTMSGSDPQPPDNTCQWQFVGIADEGGNFPGPGLGLVPYYVCLNNATPISNDRGRQLSDVLTYLIDQTGCDLAGIRSDFFEINPPGDTTGYVAGINYVTGQPNQIDQIVLLQNSDAIDPGASQPATIGEISLKEMLRVLNVKFQVLWTIDNDGYLRIEHYKYFFQQAGVDLTAYPSDKVIERQLYEHLQPEIPRVERGISPFALNRDFVGRDIVYSGPCSTDTEKEYSSGEVMTDISFVISDPSSISKKGFVMLATKWDGTAFKTILDVGAITGQLTSNAPLSWANLQRDYWTWNRYLPSAIMNGQLTNFDGFVPNYQQTLSKVLCFGCDVVNFDSDARVTSRLGNYWNGITAQIERAAFHANGKLDLSLRYSK